MNNITIIKVNGEKAPFKVEKLIASLQRAGAEKAVIDQIINEIESTIYNGITTKEIYKQAFRILKKKSRVSASRYKLKKAIMELGPSGFPFERLVGKIMEQEGFQTQVGVIVQGHCVQHEVDVIAQKDNDHYMIECKYHSDQGRNCDVKIPLYIHSRFRDIEKVWQQKEGHENKRHIGGVYTNTRFSTDAIQYGECSGMHLTSWDYPHGNGLKDRIDKSGLHPLTALTTLTRREKTQLLETGIVLCKELHENPGLVDQIGVNKSRQKKILEDSAILCKMN